MDNNLLIEEVIKQVLKGMTEGESKPVEKFQEKKCGEALSEADYPLSKKRNDLIKTKNGKSLDDINMESVLNGEITPDDIKITPEVLIYQAEIAESIGRYQFAKNLRRAAELTAVPDDRVLKMYGALRPNRSTKQELIDIADELENKYNAKICASIVREASEVYEKRGKLRV